MLQKARIFITTPTKMFSEKENEPLIKQLTKVGILQRRSYILNYIVDKNTSFRMLVSYGPSDKEVENA